MKMIYLDCCLPDYFQGFSGEVFAIPVDNTTTRDELRTALNDEYNASMGEEIDGFEQMVADLLDTDSEYDALDIMFPNISRADENAESVYAYFGVAP